MPEPSLSEISNIAVDAERGSGNPGVVYDSKDLVRGLNQAAQFKAENDWRKYQYFVNNLKEVYKDADQIAAMDVMTEDRDLLKKQAGEVFADILKDPQSIYSPKLQQKIGKMRSDATESKQNRLFDVANREFIARNPELNTDANKSKIDGFKTNPLGSRSTYNLDMPTLFDYDSFRKTIMESPTVKTKFANSTVTPDNQFIREVEGNKYDRNKFLQAWNAGLSAQQDKYGHSIKGAAKQMFNELSDRDKKYWQNNGGLEGFWNYTGQKAFGGNNDVIETVKDNIQPNSAYLDKQRLALGWANFGLSKAQLDKANTEDLLSADSTLKEAASIIKNGVPLKVENYKGSKKSKVVYEVSDPTILQTFGKIDKDGNVANTPDVIQYDKDTDELNLVYYQRESDDDGKPTGVIKTTNSGKRLVDRTIPLNSRTWLKQKVKQANPNKDIGGVNNLVEEVFTKAGGNLVDLSTKYFGGGKAPATTTSATQTRKGKDGKIYSSTDGKTWTAPDGTVVTIK